MGNLETVFTFPKWAPQDKTKRRLDGDTLSKQDKIKILRNSCSGFITKREVREYIFTRDGHKCCICGSSENLQIDHVISVYRFIMDKLDWRHANDESNLRTLCVHCNSKKRPEE